MSIQSPQTNLNDLPKDMLIKLISHVEEDSNQVIKEQSELIHLLERNVNFLLNRNPDVSKCTECHSIKKYSQLGRAHNTFVGKDIPGACIICREYKCLDHLHGECDACVVCDKCDDGIVWTDDNHIDYFLIDSPRPIYVDQIAYSDSKCDFKKSIYN